MRVALVRRCDKDLMRPSDLAALGAAHLQLVGIAVAVRHGHAADKVIAAESAGDSACGAFEAAIGANGSANIGRFEPAYRYLAAKNIIFDGAFHGAGTLARRRAATNRIA